MTSRATDGAGGAGRRRVCVVTPYLPSLTETFIRAHVARLPAETLLVHGWRPTVGDRPVLGLPRRALHKALRVAARAGVEREATAAYREAFLRHRADAVLAEYGDTGVAVLAACRAAGLPLTVHFHGYDASVHDIVERHAESYRVMFRQAAAVVAVSRAMRRRLIALGAPPEKVHYNPYGVDCGDFGGADPAAAPPVLLAVGRFTEKKAPHLTISAFAEARREFPEARLRMIGDGSLLEECRRLVARLGLGDAVTLLGAQPHAVAPEEMRRARCFVQHSVEAANGDCEGTPVAVLEAGASGLPVIATRHAGIPDVVVEGQTGLLVDERDVPGMAAHMLRLLRDPALAGRMGRAAREHVAANFSMESSLSRLWGIIESTIGGGAAHAAGHTPAGA